MYLRDYPGKLCSEVLSQHRGNEYRWKKMLSSKNSASRGQTIDFQYGVDTESIWAARNLEEVRKMEEEEAMLKLD